MWIMQLAAAIAMTLTGLGGALIAALRLRGGNPPKLLPYIHGLLAIIALILLGLCLLEPERLYAILSLGCAVAGAPMGLSMFVQHSRARLLSLSALAGHALLEIAAIAFSWMNSLNI